MQDNTESHYEPTKGIQISQMILEHPDAEIARKIFEKRGTALKNLIPDCTFYWAIIKNEVNLIMMSADKSKLYATKNGIEVQKLVGEGVELLLEFMTPL